jgi:hypothetical protein
MMDATGGECSDPRQPMSDREMPKLEQVDPSLTRATRPEPFDAAICNEPPASNRVRRLDSIGAESGN